MTECTQPSTPSAPCPTGSSNPAAAPSVSRRGFLSGAAVAAGAAALAGLAGCAPKTQAEVAGETIAADDAATGGAMQTTDPAKAVWPVVEEVEVGSAGEGVVAFVAEPIAADEIVATHDVDVVVCGLGPAGDAAALACAEQGLKTVAVEKQNRGNYNSATIGGTNSELHKFWGMEYDTTEWMSDAMIGCSFQADMTLYQHYLEKNGEAVNWYISHFDNQDFNDYPLTFAAGDFPDFREQYDPTALSRSWNTSLNLPYPSGRAGRHSRWHPHRGRRRDPLRDPGLPAGGRRGGLRDRRHREERRRVRAVQLRQGRRAGHRRLRVQPADAERALPPAQRAGPLAHRRLRQHGDGLQMGVAVGAAEDEFPQSIMLDPEQLMPFVRVNKLGKRFTPEYDPYGQLAMAIQYQPGTYDFYIVDSALDTKIDKIWTPSSSCYGPKEQWVAAAQSENAFKADTLEELAELMEVPADTFVETINHWNEMCAAGADTDFDMPGSMMMTIDQPPFYATKEFADGLCTTGGLIVDTECRVLDKDRQPIEGLFAAGIVSGGMFYNTYPHHLNCLSHTRNCLMGYTIGQVLGAKQ